MLTKGQLTVELFRRRMINRKESPNISEIKARGKLKEE